MTKKPTQQNPCRTVVAISRRPIREARAKTPFSTKHFIFWERLRITSLNKIWPKRFHSLVLRHLLLCFDDVSFRALHKCDYIVTFRRRDLKGLQSAIEVSQKSGPIAFTDFHSLMRHLHVSSDVVQMTASTRTEKINQKLLFPPQSILSSMLPESGQLRVRLHS